MPTPATLTTSAVPYVIDAILSRARTALPAVNVFDGFGNTEDPGDYLMVGVEDPEQAGAAFSADVRQSWPHVGAQARDEEGEVTCVALAWNGNADQHQARLDVYAILTAVETFLRADPSLDLPSPAWTGFGTTLQLNQAQDGDGAYAQVTFRIAFRARLTRP